MYLPTYGVVITWSDVYHTLHATYNSSTNMVINPTYLAQRTRSCQPHPIHRNPFHPVLCQPTPPFIELPSTHPLTSPSPSTAVNWPDARRRVLKSYREWLRAVRHSTSLPFRYLKSRAKYILRKRRGRKQAPEVQQMYSLNMPVSKIRTKVRSEFEKHRYVNQLGVVDVLLFQSHSEFQVSTVPSAPGSGRILGNIGGDWMLTSTFPVHIGVLWHVVC